jgi:hypothetical protein
MIMVDCLECSVTDVWGNCKCFGQGNAIDRERRILVRVRGSCVR